MNDTRTYYCSKCHREVAQIILGSRIKKGTIMICATCNSINTVGSNHKPNHDMPDFMKDIFGGKR